MTVVTPDQSRHSVAARQPIRQRQRYRSILRVPSGGTDDVQRAINVGSRHMSGMDRGRDESLDALAELCIAARNIIDTRNAPMMRSLVDMLLLEIGIELAAGRNPSSEMRDGGVPD